MTGKEIRTALDAAEYTLCYAREDGIKLSAQKLMNVLYFVQGISLSEIGIPVFEDEIQVKDNALYIEAVAKKYRKYGNGFIDGSSWGDEFDVQTENKSQTQKFRILDKETEIINKTLDAVLPQSNLFIQSTIERQAPYKNAITRDNKEISKEDLEEYFSK